MDVMLTINVWFLVALGLVGLLMGLLVGSGWLRGEDLFRRDPYHDDWYGHHRRSRR
jgi:hypothetical protein